MQKQEKNQKNQRSQKRPRIDQEREKNKNKIIQADWTVWEILKPIQTQYSKAWEERFGKPESLKYKSDMERIAKVSDTYRSSSIVEAFAGEYPYLVPATADRELGNVLPQELSLGSIVELGIKNVSKENGVTFDSGPHKEHFITRNNLQGYRKFLDFTFNGKVPARIVERVKDRTVVDIFGPMVEEFVLPRASRPWIQNKIEDQTVVLVKNLRLVNGGYLGDAVIPNISEWLGAEYTIPAFVPGSQIVLNTTEDFEEWNGKTVETFITSYSLQPRQGSAGLVCSRKAYLKHQGHLNLKALFGWWCDDGEMWADFSKQEYTGQVTGVINSSKKCGVFIEIPLLNITGMVPMSPEQLVDYPAGNWYKVRFKTFEEEMDYDQSVGQYQHRIPFEIVDGAIRDVNVKPIFEIV